MHLRHGNALENTQRELDRDVFGCPLRSGRR
jgi:hypothetical protein